MGGWVEGDPVGRPGLPRPARPVPARARRASCPSVRVAYETWGTLDADGGERRARPARAHRRQPRRRPGRPGHPTAGWWDGLIGPGRAARHRPVLRRLRQRARRLPGDDRAVVPRARTAAGGGRASRGDRPRPGAGRGRAGRRARHRPLGLRRRRLDGRHAGAGVGGGDARPGGDAVLPGLRRGGHGRPDRHADHPAGRDPRRPALGAAATTTSPTRRWTASASPAGSRTSPTAAPSSWASGSAPRVQEDGRFAVASYLDHHADKLARRFDAGSYVLLTEAMNCWDVGRGRGGVAAALARVTRAVGRRRRGQRPAVPDRAAAAGGRRRSASRCRSSPRRTGTTASSSRPTRSGSWCASCSADRLGSVAGHELRRRRRPRAVPGAAGGHRPLRRPRRHAGARAGRPRGRRHADRRRSPTAAGSPPPSGSADDIVLAARQALADLLGADPRRHRLRPQRHPADLRPRPHAGRRLGARATRSSSPGSTTTPTSGPGCSPPRRPARPCAGSAFDPATGELTADDVAEVLTDRTRLVAVTGASNLIGTRPPVAGDRRAGARGRRAAGRRRRAPHRARAGRRRRRSARTSSPARRTSSSARTAACWPPPRRCWRRCARPSCCRRPTTSPSGSSSAPCPTSCWPGRRRPSTSSPGSSPTAAPGASGWSPRWPRSRSTRTALREHLEAALRDAARRPAVVAGGAPHADPAAHLRRARRRRRVPLPRRARRQRPGRVVLRDRGQPLARPRRRRRPAGRARALHRPATTSTGCSPACGSSWRRAVSHASASPGTMPAGGSGRRTTGRTLRAEGSRS